jgi:tetratricopeptide (TPR) repeat protein
MPNLLSRALTLLLVLALASACAPAGPPTKPDDREWSLLQADYQWIQTLRAAQKKPSATASRKEQIEMLLDNHKKIEATYVLFVDKIREYLDRTSDPRAAALLAREKIALGDEYVNILARYDKGITLYREALEIEPANADAVARIAAAEAKRFVPMTSFAAVKQGMKEEEVRRLVGVPREDWIKQVVQKNRVYSVWIYPKADGGASAIYFDNGVVYHTNWNAAAPQQQPAR